MSKNFMKYLNEKVLALISLFIDLISGILLFIWKDNRSKTAITHVIEKIILFIVNAFVLLKDLLCCKNSIEAQSIEECKALLLAISKGKTNIDVIKKFVADNADNKDIKIKEEVHNLKELLKQIKMEGNKMINNI